MRFRRRAVRNRKIVEKQPCPTKLKLRDYLLRVNPPRETPSFSQETPRVSPVSPGIPQSPLWYLGVPRGTPG